MAKVRQSVYWPAQWGYREDLQGHQRMGDLADWFCYGHHLYIEPHHWPDR